MQAYQEEYLARYAAFSQQEQPEGLDPEAYTVLLLENRAEILRLSRRNMELLRNDFFPLLDDLLGAEPERIAELDEFSFQLCDGRNELDVGLFCQIHEALLSLYRYKEDRNAIIRELYWLGMGRNAICSKLVGLEWKDVEAYHISMRQCFIEAASYLKYYDEIDDTETRGYILRARANVALGQFPTPGEKIRLNKLTLDTFLSRLEALLDGADPYDFSSDGMYAMASLPAFYSQYLSQYPDRIPSRKQYLQQLYRRTLHYVDICPRKLGDRSAFQYLRQLCFTYVETEGGIPYSEVLQKLMLRTAPEIYRHSHIVGVGAKALCSALLEADPAYFDDIGFIRSIADPVKKRAAVLDYAMGCGLFHDTGKISLIEMYTRTARQWFSEEYEMAALHTLAGKTLLEARESTRRYAPIALGHHAWYDGRGGYPPAYQRADCPARRMVDVVALVDWLEIIINSTPMYNLAQKSFAAALREAQTLAGKRFSPGLLDCLRNPKAAKQLQDAMAEGAFSAGRRMHKNATQPGYREK